MIDTNPALTEEQHFHVSLSPNLSCSSDIDPMRHVPSRRETRPWRPSQKPRYEPRRDRRDAGHRRIPRAQLEGWHSPRVQVARDLGQVRINFTYSGVGGKHAYYSDKVRRMMYLEGHHERTWAQYYEVSPDITDYQFQPIAICWQRSSGDPKIYTLDCAIETVTGALEFDEIKASQAYFDDPEMRDLMQATREALAPFGATLNERDTRKAWSESSRRTVKDIFDARRATFSASEAVRAQECIHANGDEAALGQVLEAIGGPPPIARAKARAMMVHRHIDISLAKPTAMHTPVTVPGRPRHHGRLRDFMAQFL